MKSCQHLNLQVEVSEKCNLPHWQALGKAAFYPITSKVNYRELMIIHKQPY